MRFKKALDTPIVFFFLTENHLQKLQFTKLITGLKKQEQILESNI